MMSAKPSLLGSLCLFATALAALGQNCVEIHCPTNISVPCQNPAGTPVTFSVTATNFCGTNVIVFCTPPSGSAFMPGITTVNCAAIGGGQTNRCSFIVAVGDNCLTNCLTIRCPSNLLAQCAGSVPPPVTNVSQFFLRGGSIQDACSSNLFLSSSDGPLLGGPCSGTIARTYTVVDSLGNVASCTQFITVHDTIPPVLFCPTNITVEACTNRPVTYSAVAIDSCDTNITVLCTPPSGSVFALGSTLVNCQAMDRCSNRASCTFTVTLLCPGGQCLAIANEVTACVSNHGFVATFDLRNLTPGPIRYVAFTDLPPGVSVTPDLITLAAPLASGASTTLTVTFQDANAVALPNVCFRISIHNADFQECCAVEHCVPEPGCCMTLSGDSLQCTNPAGSFNYSFDLRNSSGVAAQYLFLAPSADCFSVVPDILTIQPPLPTGGTRHFSVTLRNVQPGCGPNLCFVVALLDASQNQCCAITNCIPNPSQVHLTCPSNIVAPCNGPGGAVVVFEARAGSLCGTNVPAACSPPSGSLFPPGVTTVHCQSAVGGGTNGCQFTVNVVGTCGGPCVELRCPSNVVAQCLTPAGAPVNYSVLATNPCTGLVSVSCQPPSGSQFPIGTTFVTCTAIAPGQTNRCEFAVTVAGSCSNCVEISCPPNLTALCQGPLGSRVTWSNQVFNLCGSNPPAVICSQPSGSQFPLGTTVVTCQAIAFGTTNRCSFTVTVVGNCGSNACIDLRCPSNLTVVCTSPGGSAVNYSVFATNRCSTNVSLNCIPASGSTFPPGTTTVRCTAFGSGVSNTCNFTVSVVGDCPAPLGLFVARAGDVVQLSMATTAGTTCWIEYADSFESPDWKVFQVVVGDGTTVTVTDSVQAAAQRFYRVRMDP